MDTSYTAAIFGLAGALVGTSGSVATIIIQSRIKDRRDKMQQVTSMAIEHFKSALESAHKSPNPGGVLPPSIFAAYYLGFLNLMESGKLSAETFEALGKENEIIADMAMRQGPKPIPKAT